MMVKPGDKVWIGPAEVVDINDPWVEIIVDGNKKEHTVFDCTAIPDVPHLARIVRYLTDHPETVDALDLVVQAANAMEEFIPASLPDRRDAPGIVIGLLKAMRGESGE